MRCRMHQNGGGNTIVITGQYKLLISYSETNTCFCFWPRSHTCQFFYEFQSSNFMFKLRQTNGLKTKVDGPFGFCLYIYLWMLHLQKSCVLCSLTFLESLCSLTFLESFPVCQNPSSNKTAIHIQHVLRAVKPLSFHKNLENLN